jgi:hypothetical protein
VKVLIVTANVDVLSFLKASASLAECSFVQYSHPLKALDNMAEIDPDIIVWNADDYPRHWKICRSFCPPRAADKPVALFLITEKGLGTEEEEKAQFLEVDDLVEDGFFSDSLIQILERRLPTVTAPAAIPATVEPPQPITANHPLAVPEGEGSLLVIHPELQQLLIGRIVSHSGPSFCVDFPEPDDAARFIPGQCLDTATLQINGVPHEVTLKTLPLSENGLASFLILQISG